MFYFAVADTDPAILALIAVVGTVITALFKLLNDNTKALSSMVASSEKIAHATDKGAREAKQRNGHLGEQNIQIAELVAKQNSDVHSIRESNELIAKVLSKSALIAAEDRNSLINGNQIVKQQTVEHQTVKTKE